MQFINATDMIHLVRFVICTSLPISDSRILFSLPVAKRQYTVFLSVILDVSCFHIFGMKYIYAAFQAVIHFEYI